MTILNNIFDNNIILGDYLYLQVYAGHLRLSDLSSCWPENIRYTTTGVQTDAWEDYSDRPSRMTSDSLTSLDTITSVSPTSIDATSVTQILTDGLSPVTTVLPVRPVEIEVIPNLDILSVQIYLITQIQEYKLYLLKIL